MCKQSFQMPDAHFKGNYMDWRTVLTHLMWKHLQKLPCPGSCNTPPAWATHVDSSSGVQRSKWHFVTVQTPSHELSFGISSGGWPTSQVFKARAVQQPNKAAAQVHMNVFRPPHHTPPPPPPPLAWNPVRRVGRKTERTHCKTYNVKENCKMWTTYTTRNIDKQHQQTEKSKKHTEETLQNA